MTSDTLQPKPFPDLPAAEAAPGRRMADASAAGALLRALLAGAVALLVLLVPAPAVAGHGGDGRYGASALGGRAAMDDRSRSDPTGVIEIRRHETC